MHTLCQVGNKSPPQAPPKAGTSSRGQIGCTFSNTAAETMHVLPEQAIPKPSLQCLELSVGSLPSPSLTGVLAKSAVP